MRKILNAPGRFVDEMLEGQIITETCERSVKKAA